MSIRPAEEGALTGIEHAVCASDQRLAALFAIFNRLYQDEAMPVRPRGRSRRRRLLTALVLPVLLGWHLIVAAATVTWHGAATAATVTWRAAGRAGAASRRGLRRGARGAPGTGEPRPRRLSLGP